MFGDPATNPMGWKFDQLNTVGSSVRYGLGQPPNLSINGVALIRATNIHKGIISEENMLFVDHAAVPASRDAFLKSKEVIVVRSGAYTGDIAQVTDKWEGAVAGYDLIVNPGKMFIGEFIEAYLLTSYIQNSYFNSLKTRAGQPHLNREQLEKTPVPLIPLILQEKFGQAVRANRKSLEYREKISQKQQSLFSNLLHRTFTGSLTSGWRERNKPKLETELAEQMAAIENSNKSDANKSNNVARRKGKETERMIHRVQNYSTG